MGQPRPLLFIFETRQTRITNFRIKKANKFLLPPRGLNLHPPDNSDRIWVGCSKSRPLSGSTLLISGQASGGHYF